MGYKKPDSRKFRYETLAFHLGNFTKALKECVEFLYSDELTDDERKFAYLAKRILNSLLEPKGTDEFPGLVKKLIDYTKKTGGLEMIKDRRTVVKLFILKPILAVHAQTLIDYINNLAEVRLYSKSKFGRSLLHDRCKRCKKVIFVSRTERYFCSQACYRKYKGKKYFRVKAREAYRVRKMRGTKLALKNPKQGGRAPKSKSKKGGK